MSGGHICSPAPSSGGGLSQGQVPLCLHQESVGMRQALHFPGEYLQWMGQDLKYGRLQHRPRMIFEILSFYPFLVCYSDHFYNKKITSELDFFRPWNKKSVSEKLWKTM